MDFNLKNSNLEKIIKIIFSILIIFFIFKYVLHYFTPFILGYILCLILYPITKFLVQRKVSRGLASFIPIALFLTIISFLGTTLVSTIVEQAKSFISNSQFYMDQVEEIAIKVKDIVIYFTDKLPAFIRNTVYTYFQGIIYFVKDIAQESFKVGSLGVIKKIPNFFMILVIGIVSCFFMLYDKENIEDFVYRQIPKSFRNKLQIVKEGVLTVVFGYIKAQLIIMTIMGTICFIGLTFIKAPYALLIAFIISLVDTLPVLGSGTILIPWGIYNLITKNYKFAIGLFIIYLVMLVTRQFIEHKIIGKQIGLHPLATLISIYVGLKLLGVIGIIIAPIFVVIIKLLQKEICLQGWNKYWKLIVKIL